MKRSISWFFLLLMVIISCKKDEQEIKLSGKVINPNNQNGIESADVYLDHKPVSSSIYNAGYQNLNSTMTTSDGSYTIKYEKTRSSDYRIKITKEDYFTIKKEYTTRKFKENY